ncbi:peptidyl-prolyl cis-trans isomerase, cyclophilin-type [Enterococcus moraviensis ATCC BAA-383]|uniref:Peptidyl-prolyl cis-trans isomerase n=1 Tax=Enterococcus moraviensis ATCC BAA-383 TaxID=1158609 RepID=R2QYQ4_9ENTE|nr:peptidylprolyl isomerase [Enterococcus moraviensis]EOI00516.1 peptidyl-prolyl cis-trans isomerase, cyclophilin-type [Enterococcus moraviensis ATCC BAA-383]EOT73255.1 peptidyl-prolyl cis-trans isomerase, cyclophilin-type [Enterococcus moraviensis ATCC BAA-383]OJG68811.1 peptidyl-prolyl cis-trans isomerase, cyclophilin-type [Enterococcus moraviensis]
MKTKKFIAATALLTTLVLFAACGTKNEKNTADSSKTETKTSDSVDLNALELPQLSDKVSEDEDLVEMVTTEGTIEIKLFPKQAPKTVENFMTHAKNGYYDNVTFHRVIDNFMIQGGDPKGDGSGGESIWNGSFDDEISNQLYNIRGALSMANAGKDEKGNGTNGSQFFIVQNSDDMSDGLLKDDYPEKIIDMYKNGGTPHLDGKHTVFGQVTKGMDVVDKIAAAETAEQDKPKKDIRIEKINILQEAKK